MCDEARGGELEGRGGEIVGAECRGRGVLCVLGRGRRQRGIEGDDAGLAVDVAALGADDLAGVEDEAVAVGRAVGRGDGRRAARALGRSARADTAGTGAYGDDDHVADGGAAAVAAQALGETLAGARRAAGLVRGGGRLGVGGGAVHRAVHGQRVRREQRHVGPQQQHRLRQSDWAAARETAGTDLHAAVREELAARAAVEQPDLVGDGGLGRRRWVGVLGEEMAVCDDRVWDGHGCCILATSPASSNIPRSRPPIRLIPNWPTRSFFG